MKHVLTVPEVQLFLAQHFPSALEVGEIVACDAGSLELVSPTSAPHSRPGGSVMGPVLMTIADSAAYFLLLALAGHQREAVTDQLTIQFLRRPVIGVPLRSVVTCLKLGRTRTVFEVKIYAGEPLVATAAVSYAFVGDASTRVAS